MYSTILVPGCATARNLPADHLRGVLDQIHDLDRLDEVGARRGDGARLPSSFQSLADQRLFPLQSAVS
jgi:hypothetical protein